MGWRQPDGLKDYKKSRRKRAEAIIDWAWSSISGSPKSKIAFVPFPKNKEGFSRWGCFDFDAHDGNWERALRFAVTARDALLRHGFFVILEDSGGGYHVWAIAKEFRAVREWVLILKDITKALGAPLETGICEIFPHDSDSVGPGKGVRAPGTWNPGTDTVNHIVFENIGPLIPHLISLSVKRPRPFPWDFTDTKRNNSFSLPLGGTQGLYRLWKIQWSHDFLINAPSTRHNRLTKLVGEIFRQVGYEMARGIAEAQFSESTVKMAATKKEHLAEFDGLWEGMNKMFLSELNDKEKAIFDVLSTDHEKDAFRIIHSYARLAHAESRNDFPVAMGNLGERIGVTLPGAANIIGRLIAKGAILRTRTYQANKRAAYYRWLLHDIKNGPL